MWIKSKRFLNVLFDFESDLYHLCLSKFFQKHIKMYEKPPKDFSFPYVFQQLKDSRASYKADNRTQIETHGSKEPNVG